MSSKNKISKLIAGLDNAENGKTSKSAANISSISGSFYSNCVFNFKD